MSHKNIIHLALASTGIIFVYHLFFVGGNNDSDWWFLFSGCIFVFSLVVLLLKDDIDFFG